jgi:hypothetical protein
MGCNRNDFTCPRKAWLDTIPLEVYQLILDKVGGPVEEHGNGFLTCKVIISWGLEELVSRFADILPRDTRETLHHRHIQAQPFTHAVWDPRFNAGESGKKQPPLGKTPFYCRSFQLGSAFTYAVSPWSCWFWLEFASSIDQYPPDHRLSYASVENFARKLLGDI